MLACDRVWFVDVVLVATASTVIDTREKCFFTVVVAVFLDTGADNYKPNRTKEFHPQHQKFTRNLP